MQSRHRVKHSVSEESKRARGNWSSKTEFVLSCVGYAVGLGNFWRFPYLCYKNGGGAFLIAYWILSFCAGFPIVVLEQIIGQYTSQGPMHCWRFAPVLFGAGLSMIALSFYVCFYYAVIIAWAVYYLFSSFTLNLPWEFCEPSWSDFRCEPTFIENCELNDTIKGTDGYCYSQINSSQVVGLWNETLADEHGIGAVLATEQFF